VTPEQERILREVHEAVLGTTKSIGLLEQVRDIDRRLMALEGIRSRVSNTLFDRIVTALIASASGWFAAHFGGTRP
jgi:hypothetical protein